MLCIEPFKRLSLWRKETGRIHILPSGWIAQYPGQFLFFFFYCHDRIFMSGRKQYQIMFRIIPQTIIMKPVCFLAAIAIHRS